MISIHDIGNFADKFQEEICENNVVIRGFNWFSSRIEIWGTNEVLIRLSIPKLANVQGVDNFAWLMKNKDNLELSVVVNFERLEKLITGKDRISNDEWVFYDEED